MLCMKQIYLSLGFCILLIAIIYSMALIFLRNNLKAILIAFALIAIEVVLIIGLVLYTFKGVCPVG